MREPESVGLTDCPSTTNLFNDVECCCGSGCCWDQCPKTLDVIATDFPDCLSEVANSSWIYIDDRARYEAYQAYIGTYMLHICYLLISNIISESFVIPNTVRLRIIHTY